MTHTCNPETGQSLSNNQQKTGNGVASDKFRTKTIAASDPNPATVTVFFPLHLYKFKLH